ncbi:MAG: addiction module protein [Proteobacteria bacterium]|nr:addiction module protein [Pseudomonadota bacterium]
MKLPSVLADALALPVDQRVQLVGRLLESLDESDAVDAAVWEQSWIDEINRRIAELDAGSTELIPAETVFAELRERLDDQTG